MKYTVIVALLGAAQATTLKQLSSGPAFDSAWREPNTPGAAAKNHCVNANKTDFGSD